MATVEAGRTLRPARKVASVLLAPAALVYGWILSYLSFHPRRRDLRRDPSALRLPFQELWIDAGDVRLHAWWCAAEPGSPVVVMGHGIGLTKATSLRHARFLRDAGYTVCLFDFRGHGRSDSDRSPRNLSRRYLRDVVAVVEHIRRGDDDPGRPIVLYGFSFSTFPVLQSVADLDGQVDAVVCDSGPTVELRPVFAKFLSSPAIPIPALFRDGPARRALRSGYVTGGVTMLNPRNWPPPPTGAVTTTPLLFVVGADDTIMTPAQVTEIADRYPASEVVVVPAADHLRVFRAAPRVYQAAVLDFLGRRLAIPPGRGQLPWTSGGSQC